MDAIKQEKAPAEDLPYTYDFGLWAQLQGSDTLASATVTGSPAGLTIGTPSVSGTVVSVRLSSGTVATTYRLTVSGTTAAGFKLVGYADVFVTTPPGP